MRHDIGMPDALPRYSVRGVHIALLTFGALCLAWVLIPSEAFLKVVPLDLPRGPSVPHPIDDLIRKAEVEFDARLSKQTTTLHGAADAYRQRRGRPPPPEFDVWFEFAQNHSAVVVEDFFDQIYTDLDPFWGIPAKEIREQAYDFEDSIRVRDRRTTHRDSGVGSTWMGLWSELVHDIENYLPDLDLPINVQDWSRVIVPWEEMEEYMIQAEKSKKVIKDSRLKGAFESLEHLDADPPQPFDPEYVTDGIYWSLVAAGCAPDSPARNVDVETDFSTRPPLTGGFPVGSEHGYVRNVTIARSPCERADLQQLHGTFVGPNEISTSKKLFPLFGGSKLSINNEILLPPATYLATNPIYSGGEDHGGAWSGKEDSLIWRGSGTGGRYTETNWQRFHRHRFVSTVNGTAIHVAETTGEDPVNFALPKDAFDLAAGRDAPGALGEWVSSWSDAAFLPFVCFPFTTLDGCPYTDPYYTFTDAIPMKDQYLHKYLPDIDGNSYSGRYRGFLRSTSLPIKATVYQEWHDSRLIPWYHFVPMDNTFSDIYGIMEYFVGYNGTKFSAESHDVQAEKIASQGRDWAEKALRREDMQIYVFRLLLEYARLCDDDRIQMGWSDAD
nr:beta-1,2-xylosyltransferase 1 [Quercus suber]